MDAFDSLTCSERYRDLIDAADSIVDMKKCSELVSLLLKLAYATHVHYARTTLILTHTLNYCWLAFRSNNH